MRRIKFTLNDLVLLEHVHDLRNEQYDAPDINTAKKTVFFRKSTHTAASATIDRKNRKKRIDSLRMFYDNFAQYTISPFYGKVNK